MKKKILSVLLASAMVASLTACGGAKQDAEAETGKADNAAEKTETADAGSDANIFFPWMEMEMI